MSLHIDKDRSSKGRVIECPFCYGEAWETDGVVLNGMLVRECMGCFKSYADEATKKEQKTFEKKDVDKKTTIFKNKA